MMLPIRHNYLLLLLLLVCTQSVAWTQHGNINHPRFEASVVLYENDLYVFNGFGPMVKIENTVEKYHSPSRDWSVISNTSVSSGNAVTHNGVVLIDSKVWIIGGRIGDHPGVVTDSVWIYDLTNDTWTQGPSLPTPSGGGGAAVVNNRIHVFGGFDTKAQCDVNHHFVYDLTDTSAGWQDLTDSAPMPTPRNHFATAVVNDEIYAIGGQFGHHGCGGGNLNTSLVHKFNPADGQWTKVAGLPSVQSHAEASTFEYNGLIYTVGGQANGNKVLTYDPETDEWQQILTLPKALLAPVARIINGELIVAGGGAPDVGNVTATVYSIPIASDDEETDDQEPEDNTPEDDGNTNAAPVVFAGSDFTIAVNQPVALRGTVSDDGLPVNRVNTVWRITKGPRTATFEQVHQPATVVTFTEPGDYQLTLVAYDTELLTKASIQVTVTEPDPTATNAAPVVVAGTHLSGTVNKPIRLNGSVSDDGLPINKLNIVWRVTSGPKTASFDDVNAASTLVRFSEPGSYRLTLVAYDTEYVTKESIFVDVLPPENKAPIVDAGPNLIVTENETVMLNGSVSDDGLPANRVNIIWRLTRGEDNAIFSEERQPNASVVFSDAGSYRLTLVAYDTEIVTKDSIEVTVLEETDNIQGATAFNGSGMTVPYGSPSPVSEWTPWELLQTDDGSAVAARYQAGAVAVMDRIYVIGGHDEQRVQSYDTKLNRWQDHGASPVGFHTFQPVAIDAMIYVIGSFGETNLTSEALNHVYRFDTTTNTWTSLTSIPSSRVRGAAGVAVHNGKLYIVGGNRGDGNGVSVPWFDEFNPADNSWNVLPNAPFARRQLSVAIVDSKLVVVSGEKDLNLDNTKSDGTLSTALTTDVYDFSTHTWLTLTHSQFAALSGVMTVSHASEVIVMGGYSDNDAVAHNDVRAFDVNTHQWRQLQGLLVGRQGGSAVLIDDTIHIIGGATDPSGRQTTAVHETLELPET